MKIEIAGENALILYFDDKASPEVAAKIYQAQQLIREYCAEVLIDLIPSYASILVIFDLFKCDHLYLKAKLQHCLNKLQVSNVMDGRLVELPAYYGIECAPDLAALAQRAELSIEEVITIHQRQEYRVYAIGFAPGFAYLGDVDDRIAAPRLATPRMKVPKGAIAIADKQTAVYPSISPGGWNLIGLCPTAMFNAEKEPTMPVSVGDRVKFCQINKSEFLALGGQLGDQLRDQLREQLNEKLSEQR
ncbi:MAG: allophanate hydrolase [Gammaproteobacteria bacterium]|nr:MAG: allophanate hydrolase [Gammaproteobacteria bacterium]